MQNFLDFEKPLLEIQTKIEELRHLKDDSLNIANELTQLQEKFDKTLKEIYSELTPWQKVKVCRHQDRPKIGDFIKKIFDLSPSSILKSSTISIPFDILNTSRPSPPLRTSDPLDPSR